MHREDKSLKCWSSGVLAIVSMLWIVLVISAAGVASGAIFLLLVRSLGMLYSVIVVGSRRQPGAFGIHLKFRGVVEAMATMDALLECEEKYPHAGRARLPVFFPERLMPEENEKWTALDARLTERVVEQEAEESAQDPTPGDSACLKFWTAHAKSYEC